MFVPSPDSDRFPELLTEKAPDRFYEAVGLIASDPEGRRALEIRLAIASEGPTWAERNVELSVLAMERGGAATFAVERYRWSQWMFRRGMRQEGPPGFLAPNHVRGELGEVSFDLLLGGGLGPLPLWPAERRMYRLNAGHARHYTHQASLKVAGELSVRGQTWDLEGWQGHRPHTWCEFITPGSARLGVHTWDDGQERGMEVHWGAMDIGPGLYPKQVERLVLRAPEQSLSWLGKGTSEHDGLHSSHRGSSLDVSLPDLLRVRALGPQGSFIRAITPFAEVHVQGKVNAGSHSGWYERFESDGAPDAWFPPATLGPHQGVFTISR